MFISTLVYEMYMVYVFLKLNNVVTVFETSCE